MKLTAENIIRRYEAMKTERARIEPFYIAASRYFDPISSRLWKSDYTGSYFEWNDNVSGVGLRAKNRFSKFMLGNATPASARWLVLQDDAIPEEELDAEAAEFWQNATTLISRDLRGGSSLPGSFYKAIESQFANLAVSYGVVYSHEEEVEGVRTGNVVYRNVMPQHFYFQRDALDQLEACCLTHMMTNIEARSMFDRDVIDTEDDDLGVSRSNERKMILQFVIRNDRPRDVPRNFDEFPYQEIWVDHAKQRIVRRKGYYSQPFYVMDWYRAPNSSYGYGPAYDALPDMIGASAARRSMIKAMEIAGQPPLLGGEKIQGALKTLVPGRITWNARTANGQDKISALPGITNPGTLFNLVADDEQRVANSMFEFDMNLPGQANMSATEVAERAQQRAALVAPFAIHTVPSIKGQIARHYGIAARAGRLPDLPRSIAERGEFGVDMVGPLSIAARQAEVVAMLQTIDQIAMIEQLPSQRIDKDQVALIVAQQAGQAHILMDPQETRRAEQEAAQLQQRAAEAEIQRTEAEGARAGAEAINGIVS